MDHVSALLKKKLLKDDNMFNNDNYSIQNIQYIVWGGGGHHIDTLSTFNDLANLLAKKSNMTFHLIQYLISF